MPCYDQLHFKDVVFTSVKSTQALRYTCQAHAVKPLALKFSTCIANTFCPIGLRTQLCKPYRLRLQRKFDISGGGGQPSRITNFNGLSGINGGIPLVLRFGAVAWQDVFLLWELQNALAVCALRCPCIEKVHLRTLGGSWEAFKDMPTCWHHWSY